MTANGASDDEASWGSIIRTALLFATVVVLFFMVSNTIKRKPLLTELQLVSLPFGIALGALGAWLALNKLRL